MKNNRPFLIALIAGSCATFCYFYRKNKILTYEKNLFLQKNYSEYIKITKDKISDGNIEMFIYAAYSMNDYNACLEKTKNYLLISDANTILFVSKYRLLAGIQLFRYDEVFGDSILTNAFSMQKFYSEESEIVNEKILNFTNQINQPDFYLIDDLLETFPLLYKEFKSHINSQLLIAKNYFKLILQGQGPAFRFLTAIFNYIVNSTNIFTDEKYFYTVIFKEYLLSSIYEIEPSMFKKENVSSCFYKSLIYKNNGIKSKYLFWLGKAMNYEENGFVYKYVINEMIVTNTLHAYELCKKVINTNFKYFLPVILKIAVKLKIRDSEYFLKLMDKDALFYLYSAVNDNYSHSLLEKAYELQPNSFIILYNYGISLLLIYDLNAIFYFKKCTKIKYKECVRADENLVVVYLEEVLNIVKYKPNLKKGLVDYVIRRLSIEFID